MPATLNASPNESENRRVNHPNSTQGTLSRRLASALLQALLLSVMLSSAHGQSSSQAPVSQPAKATAQTDAQKAFKSMKALTGSWQGTIMGISINFTIRAASSGTVILLEGHTSGGQPPNHEITMVYLDGDRLLATHYCDAGNRSRMEGKMSPDGKAFEFGFLEVTGSTRGGYLKDMKFTLADADHHIIDFTFVMPDGKPMQLRGEFQRTSND